MGTRRLIFAGNDAGDRVIRHPVKPARHRILHQRVQRGARRHHLTRAAWPEPAVRRLLARAALEPLASSGGISAQFARREAGPGAEGVPPVRLLPGRQR
jgi:hypothetical protein